MKRRTTKRGSLAGAVACLTTVLLASAALAASSGRVSTGVHPTRYIALARVLTSLRRLTTERTRRHLRLPGHVPGHIRLRLVGSALAHSATATASTADQLAGTTTPDRHGSSVSGANCAATQRALSRSTQEPIVELGNRTALPMPSTLG